MAQEVKLARGSRLVVWASICIVVAALYLAKEVLMPLALAILLTFLFAPLVDRLERLRVPRAAAVMLVVLASLGLLGGIGYLVERQFVATATQLPQYTDQIRAKLSKMGSWGDGLTKAATNIGEAMKSASPTTGPATTPASQPAATETTGTSVVPGASVRPPAQPPADQPVDPALPRVTPENPLPVRSYPQAPSPVSAILGHLQSAVGPLAMAGMVLIFVVFMLMGREDLRDRGIRLMGGARGQVTVTTKALSDAAERVSRFLLMQLIVNVTYGITIAIGLFVIGKFSKEGYFPSVLLWGLLCTVLRFIPYIGPWIAAAFPVALSFAMFESPAVFFATLGLFVVIELLSNNVMEPWLYGSSTGISTVAILVSAVFWTWLWGAIGLLMATPLTVCLVVIGKHVPQLQFLDIMLGDEPVLDPPTRLYQRLLARDQDEAGDLAGDLMEERGLERVYDEVLVPALSLAEHDRRRGRLDPDRHDFIRRAMRSIVTDLAEAARLADVRSASDRIVAMAKGEAPTAGAGGGANGSGAGGEAPPAGPLVVCLPAEDEDDELAALMFGQLLERVGYRATVASHKTLANERIEAIDRGGGTGVVCVSALPPAAIPHSRYLVKRVRSRSPDMPILVGLWTETATPDQAKERIGASGPIRISTTLTDAIAQVRQLAPPELAAAAVAAS